MWKLDFKILNTAKLLFFNVHWTIWNHRLSPTVVFLFHSFLVPTLPEIFLSSLGFPEQGFNFMLVPTGSQQNTTKIILGSRIFIRVSNISQINLDPYKGFTEPFLKLISMITHVKHKSNPMLYRAEVKMQGNLFQMCTHFFYCCSVLSLGGKVNTRRMSQSDMESIFTKIIYEIFWS